MEEKILGFIIKGMQRDLSVSKFNPEFAFENMNIRVTARDNNTLLSITNERGNKVMPVKIDSLGKPVNIMHVTYENIEYGHYTIATIKFEKPPVLPIMIWFNIKLENGEVYKSGVEILDESAIPVKYTMIGFGTFINMWVDDPSNTYFYSMEGDIYLQGTFLGYNILGNVITLFTLDTESRIYKLTYSLENKCFIGALLYKGNLGFDVNHPIETIGIYENEDIQKVYWVDGINLPRVINISKVDIDNLNDNSFNFVQQLQLKEDISVERVLASGEFPPGVILYAFSYYNRYGAESNIFYTTPLLYTSFNNRGGSPEEKVNNAFNINIKNVDLSFLYLRIYSIHRTSIDAVPIVKILTDLSIISNELNYIDSGFSGSTIDPILLLYIGGEDILAGTLALKDNTLFLGNIRLQRPLLSDDIVNSFRGKAADFYLGKSLTYVDAEGYYPYENQLKYDSFKIKTFKYLDWYRLGVLFQHRNGKWSEVCYIRDVQNNIHISNAFNRNTPILLPIARCVDESALIINKLVESGYVRARGVICYPDIKDREVIALGILCPTVYNVEDRFNNSPFVYSSWFTRPNLPFDYLKAKEYTTGDVEQNKHDWRDRDNLSINSGNSKYGLWNNDKVDLSIFGKPTVHIDDVTKGAYMEFRHDYAIPANNNRNAEILSIGTTREHPYLPASQGYSNVVTWVSDNPNLFYVDQSILTFHSPDILFDDRLRLLDYSNIKLRIVGAVPITSFNSDIDIQTSTPALNPNRKGFHKEFFGVLNISRFGFRGLVSGAFWMDDLSKKQGSEKLTTTGFMVYPWHRNGSLNNFGTPDTDNPTRPAMLSRKKMSNLRFSYNTIFLDKSNIWEAYRNNNDISTGISGISIFDSNEQVLTEIPALQNSGLNNITYYGNVDKVVPAVLAGVDADGYPIITTGVTTSNRNYHTILSDNLVSLVDSTYTTDLRGTEPVRIKYKSTPHAVLALNYTKDTKLLRVLPTITDSEGNSVWPINSVSKSDWDLYPFYNFNNWKGVSQDAIPLSITSGVNDETLGYGWLWLAELYNDNIVNRFGGSSKEALLNNIWYPCSEPVSLLDSNNNPVTSYLLDYTEGDTFYQRFDCLKTYPYTNEDLNSVVDIVSFMCESRINIDGRYDKNRGLVNNLVMSPTNFNLLNPVYSLYNSFFNYRVLDRELFNLDYFPNQIVWSRQKTPGEIIDKWTNINLTSSLDLDGDKGNLNAIRRLNNELYAFLDKAISRILFNSRVLIPTSEGTPIEIANSYKVDGKIYISQNIGCLNKWSIVNTPRGLYFIDNLTNGIFVFDGEGFLNLSDNLGFRTFINDNNSTVSWDANNFNNFISYYDATNDDVYFINKDYCLCYSELLGLFTSFYSYNNIPLMFNVQGNFYSLKDNTIWELNTGDYNSFYGELKPYYTTIIGNSEEPLDKIFTNLEFRADTYDGNTLLNNTTFDTLEIWNEYQYGISNLRNLVGRPSDLKKKFRIWRVNLPRDSRNNRDRIRNTWSYIKLAMNNPNNYRTELHDMVLHYFA